MKIGIDARLYGLQNRGLGRYVKNLVDGLLSYDPENHYVIFLAEDNFADLTSSAANYKKVLLPARWYSLKEQFLVSRIMGKSDLDLVHFPHFNVPLNFQKKFIVTIHDLIIDHFPDSRATTLPKLLYRLKLASYRYTVKNAVKKSSKIIIPSEFVKQDLQNLYQAPKEKLKVIYENYEIKSNDSAINLPALGISRPYFLFVGAAYPHKNLERLIAAFRKFNRQGNYQLVLAGKIDYFYQRLMESFNGPDLVFTKFVDDNQLHSLYQQALAYIFPSLYEGFGLPAIEAQSLGLPVIAANNSCLPEILRDSAIYFDPLNEQAIYDKLDLIAADPSLRASLAEKGRLNVQRFSLEQMVRQTIEAYQSH